MLDKEGGVCSSNSAGGASLVSFMGASKKLSEDPLHDDEVAVLEECAPGELVTPFCVINVETVDEEDSVSSVQTELQE